MHGAPVADQLPETAIPAAASAGLRTIPPREIGGNLDIRQLVAGSRITLPVHVEGALVSVGDLHFAQGDGEVCGTGIEVAGAVTLRFAVRKEQNAPRLPTFETPARPGRRAFATTGIALDTPMDIDAAARVALLEMIDYLARQARRRARRGLRPVLRRRGPADLGGRGRPLPARVRAPSARHLRALASP